MNLEGTMLSKISRERQILCDFLYVKSKETELIVTANRVVGVKDSGWVHGGNG